MSEIAVEIAGLSKAYDKSKTVHALQDVSLKIKKGSFFGLLGPNGAGKSTLINILGGLVKKDSGTIKISGIDVDDDQKATKFKIGIVPQELVMDPFFTVYETLEIYAGYFGIRQKDRRTKEIIAALGLTDKINAKPRSLSGGMKRRLLVAKALVHSPDILVLDEPTAGVDVELRTQLWQYVRKLNEQGTTIILTTHYLEEAEELCDEIAVLNKGKVIAWDSKKNLMDILGEKKMTIYFESKQESPDFKLPEGSSIQGQEKNILSIQYDPKKVGIVDLFECVSAAGVDIQDVSTSQADLEDVFRFLVNK